MEETIFKLVESLNELIDKSKKTKSKTNKGYCLIRCVRLYRIIYSLCCQFKIDMPEESIPADIFLDEYFDCGCRKNIY